MNPIVWGMYLLGKGAAIRELAENRATIWVGIILVLLTSIARNYDQTLILEKPFFWLFGALLFSLVSGTWLYLVVYTDFIRSAAADADDVKPEFWGRWRTFMGLFWMTAPVAWLYAIPVERCFDSLTAAKANLLLLGIVSLWRVLLMTRVVQFLTRARFIAVLLWVLFAAAVEILVVFFFGGAFAQAIMRGMGGMRNSPEEALVLSALGSVFSVAVWGSPVLLITAFFVGRLQTAEDLPAPVRSSFNARWLIVFAVIWIGLAVLPQIELSRNVKVERLMAAGEYRAALNYMSARERKDFSPARVLVPNAYEYPIFEELPACFAVVQANDAPWVQAHLLQRLDQMLTHSAPWRRKTSLEQYPVDEQIDDVADGLKWYGPDAERVNSLLDGLGRISAGRDWLNRNSNFLAGVQIAVGRSAFRDRRNRTEAEQLSDVLSLSNRLYSMGLTNFSAPVTNH